jgi:hypothetical protein
MAAAMASNSANKETIIRNRLFFRPVEAVWRDLSMVSLSRESADINISGGVLLTAINLLLHNTIASLCEELTDICKTDTDFFEQVAVFLRSPVL